MEPTTRHPARGASGPRRRTVVVAGLVAAVLLAVAGSYLVQRERSVTLDLDTLGQPTAPADAGAGASSRGGSSRSPVGADLSDQASRLLSRVADAVAAGDRRSLLALDGGSERSRAVLARWGDNADALDLRDVAMRFVAPRGQTRGRWWADVEVGYLDPATGSRPVLLDAAVRFASVPGEDGGSQVVVVGAGTAGARTPLWMSSRLTVARRGQVDVRVAAGASLSADRVLGLGSTAVRQVGRSLPGWDGPLVLEVPSSTVEVAHVLGEPEGVYDAVAAVTTTVDGGAGPGAPVHVVVNPTVLGTLGNRGEQVVLTHEAVHVATRAATSPGLPLWLMEGYADWVALRVADLPDDVAAGALLEQVRADGPPARLPGPVEFDPAGQQFGVSYEAAWLAVRLLAQEYGAAAVIDFYDRLDAGETVEAGFARLGTTEADFTASWQDYLRELAQQPADEPAEDGA